MQCELLPVMIALIGPTVFTNDGDGVACSSIVVKPEPSSSSSSPSTPWTNGSAMEKSSSDPDGMIYNHRLNQKWLEGLGKFPGKRCQLGLHSLYPFVTPASDPDADSLF